MTSSTIPSARRPSAGPVLRQPQQPGLPVHERAERLPDDDRLGAAAADPALDRAVGMDDPPRAGLGGRRPLDRHDRGDREPAPVRLQRRDPRRQAPVGHR